MSPEKLETIISPARIASERLEGTRVLETPEYVLGTPGEVRDSLHLACGGELIGILELGADLPEDMREHVFIVDRGPEATTGTLVNYGDKESNGRIPARMINKRYVLLDERAIDQILHFSKEKISAAGVGIAFKQLNPGDSVNIGRQEDGLQVKNRGPRISRNHAQVEVLADGRLSISESSMYGTNLLHAA